MLQLPAGQAACSTHIAGTVGWLDPQMLAEERDGRVDVAPSCDMFAFGLLCAQLLTQDPGTFLPCIPELTVTEEVVLEDGVVLPAGGALTKCIAIAKAYPHGVHAAIVNDLGPLLQTSGISPQCACLASIAIRCTNPVVGERPSAQQVCEELQQAFGSAWSSVSAMALKHGCAFGPPPEFPQQPEEACSEPRSEGEAGELGSGAGCDPRVGTEADCDLMPEPHGELRDSPQHQQPSSIPEGSDCGGGGSLVQRPGSSGCSDGSGSTGSDGLMEDAGPAPLAKLTGEPCLQRCHVSPRGWMEGVCACCFLIWRLGAS